MKVTNFNKIVLNSSIETINHSSRYSMIEELGYLIKE